VRDREEMLKLIGDFAEMARDLATAKAEVKMLREDRDNWKALAMKLAGTEPPKQEG
jgi:hypothetical protein